MDLKSKPCTVFELCHPVNLRYVAAEVNLSKGAKKEVKLRELRERIRIFNEEYGDPWSTVPRLIEIKQSLIHERSLFAVPTFRDAIRKSRVGEKLGRLTVIAEKRNSDGYRMLECRCECGNITEIHKGSLGNTQSCGCLRAAPRLSPGFLEREYVLAGKSYERIARDTKCSPSTVRRAIIAAGIDPRAAGGCHITSSS